MLGFKIKRSKSALLHLNDTAKTSFLMANIPSIQHLGPPIQLLEQAPICSLQIHLELGEATS